MNNNPITNLAITTALWLTLLPGIASAQNTITNAITDDNHQTSQQAQIFLQAGDLTSIDPLYINFHPQQLSLEEENMKQLKKWIKNIKKMGLPIHIYSYATPPISRRDMTSKSAQHMAIRKAFNRAIDTQNALQSEGIPIKLIALHAIGAKSNNPTDQLHITIRNIY